MAGQQAAPAYRIYHGDTILVTLWSNVAAAVDGFFRVVYDDGTTDTLRIDRVTTTSARAAFLARAAHVAKHDGYVTEGVLFADSPQRGQTYAIAYVSQGEGPGDVRMALCKGYVYASTPLAVGQQVEPGPAGGPGAVTRVNLTFVTPSGGSGGLVLSAVPTGALRKWIWARIVYTASVTVGSRAVRLRFRDASGNFFGNTVFFALTASQIGLFVIASNISTFQTLSSLESSAGNGESQGVESPAPDRALPAGYDLFMVDTANIDAAGDQGGIEGQVEEWVVPN